MTDEKAGGDCLSPSEATKLMQQRLNGAEKDTKDLAQMLVDLGISPPRITKDESSKEDPDNDATPTIESLLSDANALISRNKDPKKTVSFAPTTNMLIPSKHTKASVPSILKKSTVPPIKLQFGESEKIKEGVAAAQYQHMVSRMCKTESVIQSLKLSLCSLQTSKEMSEREKISVIQRLKEEINEKESEVTSVKEKLKQATRDGSDAERRWQEAEEEVKNLQQQLQDLTDKQHGKILMSDSDMRAFRDKSAKRVAEAKEEVLRERSLRKSLEESHTLLLTRVNDVEENVEHERLQVVSLRDDCTKLRHENEKFREQGAEWTKKAAEMDVVLRNLKEELDAKEKAIRVLVNEQNCRDQESSQLANHQANLNKQLRECNVILEAQKAAFTKLEMENKRLCDEKEEAHVKIQQLDEEMKRKATEHLQELHQREVENQNKIDSLHKNLQKDVRAEKSNAEKLDDRIRILEDCVQQQEKIIQERETEALQTSEELTKRLEEEKMKLRMALKEKDDALRSKDAAAKELSKGTSSLNQEKGLIEQQLHELQLEHDAVVEAKRLVEEENGRLMERSSAVQQQEAAYKRMQDTLNATNEAKSKLAYDKGKLQTRVQQLEEEIQALASIQSQLLQVRSANHTLEQKYSRASSELATAKIEWQRMDAQVKQMSVAMNRKESDFSLAIEARDQALREKEELEGQMDTLKENEGIRIHQLRRSLAECKSDNARMAETLENVMTRHNDLQETLDSLQTQLGRKDSEVLAMAKERQGHIQQIQATHVELEKMRDQLNEFDMREKERMAPVLSALEETKQDNERMASSLEDVLKANAQLKEKLQQYEGDIDCNQRRLQSMERREEALIVEAENVTRTHAERMDQAKTQFAKERDVLRKQLQSQISEVKKSLEATQSRCTQLARGNSELRGRLAEKERAFEKLKDRSKSQKSTLDRLQRERQHSVQTNDKIKEINEELHELEKVKSLYMEKNRQQAITINTFNAEVSSLKTDILALGSAQQHAKELNERLEKQVGKEKSEKAALLERTKELQFEFEKCKREKQQADERLQKVQLETMHVQQNLNEAQTWFTQKFERLQAELNRSKGLRSTAQPSKVI